VQPIAILVISREMISCRKTVLCARYYRASNETIIADPVLSGSVTSSFAAPPCCPLTYRSKAYISRERDSCKRQKIQL
jgi:hypothetical protein